MSYCHLIGSVGINWNNGFGPQPADRITNYINNASCLTTCGVCTDEGQICDDGDNCTINDVYDANCNCVGVQEPDSDGDGVCDAEDVCLGFNDGLIGTSCSDGDICTENDVYTSNCLCEGTYADSDNDGVCNAEDICPGFDDGVDSDNDGIPDGCDADCNVVTGVFSTNPLTHSGGGNSSSTIVFGRTSQAISFTISNINAQLNGNPNSRYDERFEVTYLDENNNTQSYGIFSGSQGSSYNVSIGQRAKSVAVTLSDGYDGNANGLSVTLSSVEYCEDDSACTSPDSDGDGVCDAEDVCSGADDSIDTDGDGIPDGCDSCNDFTASFNSSTLTHSGTGNTFLTEAFGQVVDDVSFSVSGLGSRTNGKADRRYIDEVTITYLDQVGQSQNYGTFSGSSVSSVNVSIASISSVTVSLSDSYDGNADGVSLSVSLSGISGCEGVASAPIAGTFTGVVDAGHFNFYPNPTQGILHLDYQSKVVENNTLYLRFYDLSGKVVKELDYQVREGHLNRKVNVNDLIPSVYFVQLQDGKTIISKKLIVMRY